MRPGPLLGAHGEEIGARLQLQPSLKKEEGSAQPLTQYGCWEIWPAWVELAPPRAGGWPVLLLARGWPRQNWAVTLGPQPQHSHCPSPQDYGELHTHTHTLSHEEVSSK